MALMDNMVRSIRKEKREKMMVDMMPLMMEGINMNEFMPKMMANMLKDLTADDLVKFFSELFSDNEKLANFGNKIAEANMMPKMMMKVWKSKLGFEETVAALQDAAPKNNWHIPDTRDLQKLWADEGVENPPRIRILYFCNAHGGNTIASNDDLRAMTVMMPTGVSVYETSTGDIKISAMNLGMMAGMFAGVVKETLSTSAENLNNCVKDIVE